MTRRSKRRRRARHLTPNGRDQSGANGRSQNCMCPASRPMRALVVVESSEAETFDYWLRISTLDKGKPLRIPVRLSSYHKKALEGCTLNTSTTLSKRNGVWWLTLSFDEDVPVQTEPSAPCVGVDVGMAHFLTTSTGKHYGSFHGQLRERQKRGREKRRRKALRSSERASRKRGWRNCPRSAVRLGNAWRVM